jgi:hypothetical protein
MKELQSVNEWYDVLEKSKEAPLFVLKHSTTCARSVLQHIRHTASRQSMPRSIS